ncbi:site-specific integrase [Phycisphaerales bacterium ac7]
MGSLSKRGRMWLAQFVDAEGIRRIRSTGSSDKREAERILRKWESEAALRREGVIDIRLERVSQQIRRPLAEHLEDYEAAMRTAGRANHTVATNCRYIRELARAMEATSVGGLTHDKVSRTISDWTVEHRNGVDAEGNQKWRTEPASARTKNAIRSAVIGFCNWMCRVNRLQENHLKHLPRYREDKDRKRVRRALTDEELRSLFSVARLRDAELNADPNYPHGPSNRLAWYMAAALAGLRRGDLVKLTWGCVDFENSYLLIRDGKAQREDYVPLDPQLAEELARIRPNDASPTERVFQPAVTNRTRKLDFERAGIGPDSEGRVPDLHALRTTLATRLARAGVAPQVARQIMRHSDIRTTTKAYTALLIQDGAAGLKTLPRIEEPKPVKKAM